MASDTDSIVILGANRGSADGLLPAAEYIRMSTDHQKYSPANQSEAIHIYAATHGMTIVRSYADLGKSGLHLDGRKSLKRLIEDIESGEANFSVVLVYDVSRWGRFQDTDESAHYEYVCRRAGISVRYCAEQFENDGSPLSAIVKAIKRAMAGEYSRELSIKVFAAQRRLVKLGYRLGGAPGYGLRRLLINEHGVSKGLLSPGERKSIYTDRILLVPGPEHEVATVRWIYEMFARRGKGEGEIADLLNRRNIKNVNGRVWNGERVHDILTNEKYIGNNVWNRHSIKLKGRLVSNKPDEWIRVKGAFQAIISPSMFEEAQAIIRERRRTPSQDEMLEPLRKLLRKHGYLSVELIKKSRKAFSIGTYARYFRNLPNAYRLAGFDERSERWPHANPGSALPQSDEELLGMLKRLWEKHGSLSQRLIDCSDDVPCCSTFQRRFGSIKRAYDLIGYRAPAPGRFKSPRSRTAMNGLSDAQFLNILRSLLQAHGFLSARIITETTDIPSVSAYQYRFGSLARAYALIGYTARQRTFRSPREIRRRHTSFYLLQTLRQLLAQYGRLSSKIIDGNPKTPRTKVYVKRFGSLTRAYALIGYRRGNPR